MFLHRTALRQHVSSRRRNGGEQGWHKSHPFPQNKPIWMSWVSEVASLVWVFVTPWAIGRQASLSMGFSRQEYWSGLPFPSPGKSHLENTTIHLDLYNPVLKLLRYIGRNAQRECQGTKGTRKLVKSQKGRLQILARTLYGCNSDVLGLKTEFFLLFIYFLQWITCACGVDLRQQEGAAGRPRAHLCLRQLSAQAPATFSGVVFIH